MRRTTLGSVGTRSFMSMLGFVAVAAAWGDASAAVPIVYSRCVRTPSQFTISGQVTTSAGTRTVTKTMRGADIYDVMPDVINFFKGFSAPCDLVYRNATGTERVIYNCTGTSTDSSACAALDPSVSFDGTKVVFSVFRGSLYQLSRNFNAKLLDPNATNTALIPFKGPNKYLNATSASIFIATIATSNTPVQLTNVAGVYDSGPAFLSNGRITFTSTRAADYRTKESFSNSATSITSQIYTMDQDGKNVERSNPSGLARDEHPFQLRDGRVAFSSWQLHGLLPFRRKSSYPGRSTGVNNIFELWVQNPDGSNPGALLGQHFLHTAFHFLGQTTDGRVWTGDYYRINNFGLGNIRGFTPAPAGQEGPLPNFAPTTVTASTWGSTNDAFAKPMSETLYVPNYNDRLAYIGKIGHPAGSPSNKLLLVWGMGACSAVCDNSILPDPKPPFTIDGELACANIFTHLNKDTPACDLGVYETTVIPSTTPADLARIVNKEEYHEIFPKAAVTYNAVHGVAAPAVIKRADLAAAGNANLERGTPFGIVGSSTTLLRETMPDHGVRFQDNNGGWEQGSLKGTDTIQYTDNDICGVRIIGVQPNKSSDGNRHQSMGGERLFVMGEFPVRNYSSTGTPIVGPLSLPDTSFRVRIPANTPYLLQGIDCDGRNLSFDQSWQAMRPGEVKTCKGCHVHSKEGMTHTGTYANNASYVPYKLGEGQVPLLNGGTGTAVKTNIVRLTGYGKAYEYTRDVWPIIQSRCASCHDSASPAGGLVLDVPGTSTSDTAFYRIARDYTQAMVPLDRRAVGRAGDNRLDKPQLSKYIRAFASRNSLFFWKAANKRLDNRTDSFSTTDVNFGASHSTTITKDELGILSRWIDTGCGAGSDYAGDTTRPSISMVADVNSSNVVTYVRVGTVDVPSGINTASLNVCVVTSGVCGPNLATGAHSNGVKVIAIPSSAGSNAAAEIRASVKDLAGNESTIQYSIAWLRAMRPASTDALSANDSTDTGEDLPLPGDHGEPDSTLDDATSAQAQAVGCSALSPTPVFLVLTILLWATRFGRRR